MGRATGQGKVKYRMWTAGGKEWFRSRLYNYDIACHQPKTKHLEWLKVAAYVAMANGVEVRLYGAASRSGGVDSNRALSRRRAEAVKERLVGLGVGMHPGKIVVIGVGEIFGWVGEIPLFSDENEEARAVEIHVRIGPSGSRSSGGYVAPSGFVMPPHSPGWIEWE